jgi:hypothetical protein
VVNPNVVESEVKLRSLLETSRQGILMINFRVSPHMMQSVEDESVVRLPPLSVVSDVEEVSELLEDEVEERDVWVDEEECKPDDDSDDLCITEDDPPSLDDEHMNGTDEIQSSQSTYILPKIPKGSSVTLKLSTSGASHGPVPSNGPLQGPALKLRYASLDSPHIPAILFSSI